MVIKTITAISLYLAPFSIIVFLKPGNLFMLFGLWILMGIAKAFIGTSVMHDALHGSYSKEKSVNHFLNISAWMLGIDPRIWKLQHNVLHHTYTNIEGADEDISPRYILRFSPNQPLKWFHKFQHIYAVFFYSNFTIFWVFIKDFAKAIQYRNRGLLKNVNSFTLYIGEIILIKLIYVGIILIIPIYVLPVSAGMVVLMFVAMHLTSGLLLSMIFQPAHVMETSEFIDQTDGDIEIEENWLAHQLKTTSNFGMKSKLLFWFSGGLNHQIEHHLFPNICHVHYWNLSKIVRTTADEYGLPYYTQPTLSSAVYNHLKMLKALGKGQI